MAPRGDVHVHITQRENMLWWQCEGPLPSFLSLLQQCLASTAGMYCCCGRTPSDEPPALRLSLPVLPCGQVIRVLQQRSMLPAIWFIMSRRDCDLSAIAAAADLELVTPNEAAELNDELQHLL